jgi:hypothetical protein
MNTISPAHRIGRLLIDDGLAWALAGLAAAGSFTHIRDLAIRSGQSGWMANAIAVCIDLMCVMAARERKRDQRLGRQCGPLAWPTVVLVLGICLTIAANLATAQQTPWGWIMAATPAATFLVAVSMLERRATCPDRTGDIRTVTTDTARTDVRRPQHADPKALARPQTLSTGDADPADMRADSAADHPRRLPPRSRATDIEVRARAVLAQRPDVTGADLGRELGVTERHGRRLRNRLRPLGA